VLIRGPLLHVKGFLRRGPRLAERIAEIRTAPGGREQQLVWYRLNKDGGPDLTKPRHIDDLSGAAAEAVELQQHPGLHTFRVFVLPKAHEDPLDFAAPTAAERTQWLEAFSRAAEHPSEAGAPLCGTLRIAVTEASLQLEQPALRRQLFSIPEIFAVVRCGGMECRTPQRRPQGELDAVASFVGSNAEFPITDDDPDSLVAFEVWAAEGRRRLRLRGRADVPLYCFGRNAERELHLPLRNVMRLKGENNEVGTISIKGRFEQPLQSLLLPRQSRQSSGPVVNLGDQTLRHQFQEFEAFLREFEVFSSRFMHHCDVWRHLSFTARRIVQWDSPLLTLACLLALTVVIGFFHEYALPIAVLALLCVATWQHPWCCRWRGCLCHQRPVATSCSVASPQPAPLVKERFENERRLVFGKFMSLRLRFYDPPAWCDADGYKAEAPKSLEEGVHYVWHVEVNEFTDSDGWRYSRSFSRHAVWSRAFQHQMFVRRRRHIGRPVPGGGASAAAGEPEASSLAQVPSSRLSAPNLSRRPTMLPSSLSAACLHAVQIERSGSMPEASMQKATTAEGGKGPEFGIAKTPFHDMYQQYMLRWGVLQRQIEYWMDWYERRKNLFLGATLPTQNFACLGVLVLLIIASAVPTRWLALAWIYTFFYDGLALGRLMRKNQNTFINVLKDTAVTLWLESDEARARVASWGFRTSLDEVIDAGVQLLVLRDWIRAEFFEGRPLVPLRAVQRCGTLGELAVQITWTSDYFTRKRPRPRVWYRSTLRNLLDHVPSDVTLFQPLTCKGLGDGSQ